MNSGWKITRNQAHADSCAIEGNSFTVDDTQILREQGVAMVPVGRSLLECVEMADHFCAFDYMSGHLCGKAIFVSSCNFSSFSFFISSFFS